MADEKKDAKKADGGSITLLNRGKRTFDHGFEVKADGKPDLAKPIKHAPGQPFAYQAEEGAKLLAQYPKELYDLSKLPGAVDAKQLKADNAALAKDNEALKARLAELEAAAAKSKKLEQVKP